MFKNVLDYNKYKEFKKKGEGMKMKMQKRGLLVVILMIAVSTPIAWAEMPRGQSLYDTTHALTVVDPNFYTEFGSSGAEFVNEIWAIAGEHNTTGQSPIKWISTGNLQVGDSFWFYGSVIYHFHTDDLFNGGTVETRVDYQGGVQHMYIATTAVEPTGVDGWKSFTLSAYDQKMYDTFWGLGIYTVNIPAGVKDFWVVLAKPAGVVGPSLSVEGFHEYLDVAPNVIVDPNGCVNDIESDVNDDCIVDFVDFVIVAGGWLECTDADNPAECYPF